MTEIRPPERPCACVLRSPRGREETLRLVSGSFFAELIVRFLDISVRKMDMKFKLIYCKQYLAYEAEISYKPALEPSVHIKMGLGRFGCTPQAWELAGSAWVKSLDVRAFNSQLPVFRNRFPVFGNQCGSF